MKCQKKTCLSDPRLLFPGTIKTTGAGNKKNRGKKRRDRSRALLTLLDGFLLEFLVPLDPVTFTRYKTLARLRLHCPRLVVVA